MSDASTTSTLAYATGSFTSTENQFPDKNIIKGMNLTYQ